MPKVEPKSEKKLKYERREQERLFECVMPRGWDDWEHWEQREHERDLEGYDEPQRREICAYLR